MNTISLTMVTDEQLWQQSRAGDREAFGHIVERYQTLICSLAYSVCGDLARSEDLAQETFVAAWRNLADLRDASKLRAWLCGIVRNRTANALRREFRRGGAPENLEVVADEASASADPAAQAVTREEEALLWRALSGLPENYREPMVLFYREQHSVAEVATGLDLSEDAVKQRLSRGRSMLREEMAKLVESALTRSRPTAAFTVGVLAALPFVSARTASAASTTGIIAGKGVAAVTKSILATAGSAVLGPVIGLFIGFFGSKAAALTSRSKMERKCVRRHTRRIVLFCWVMSIGLAAVLSQAGKLYPVSPGWLVFGVCAWVAALVIPIHVATLKMQREVRRIRAETGTEDS